MTQVTNKLMHGHFVDGAWLQSSGEFFESTNPATNAVLWAGNAAQENEVAAAVNAARQAFQAWCLLDIQQRITHVSAFIKLLETRREALAQTIHEETGKPLWESKTEIATMIAKAAISIKAYEQRTGSQQSNNGDIHIALSHRPIGVFAVLGPYNFPGHLPNGHIIPALIAGNTIVFKPSELTPLFGELMIQCWADSGLPRGVVNLVQGAGDTGKLLAESDSIDGLLFTGSSKTGQAIHQYFGGKTEKMLALEMGGNNPLVVDQVADTAAACYAIIQSAFVSGGQRCTCARRLILVRNDSNKTLVDALKHASAAIKVGGEDDCFIGPLVSNKAADAVMAYESQLLLAGATELLPLRRPEQSRPFVHPGIIDVSNVDDRIDEECFGPLLQVIWVDSLEDAVIEANNTRYGLSAGLLSDSEESWAYFYRLIRAGIVNWNRPITGASGSAPFGGIGASGNFKPGAFYAADYCAYPIASMSSQKLELPAQRSPGL